MIDAFRLPAQALVAHRIPKKMLVELGAPTAADKRLINDTVDELLWHAALKPGTIGVPAFHATASVWAVVVDVDGEEKLFFVVETKGSLFDDALRDAEVGKIMCGAEHVATIAAPGGAAKFIRAKNVGDLEKRW